MKMCNLQAKNVQNVTNPNKTSGKMKTIVKINM